MTAGWRRQVLSALLYLPCAALPVISRAAAQIASPTLADTDHDGLSDHLEQQLLTQFSPRFSIGDRDCSVRPAAFQPGLATPTVAAVDGTLYGQATPHPPSADHLPQAELHFYHLWQTDCGRHGHPLDAEHVAVLVQASSADLASATWKALYWYAAAHEDTVCDVSQIARASTLHAEHGGAAVWISPGKHASYLNESLCSRGCGADRCERMVPLTPAAVVNLGEPTAPMNGSVFLSSAAWPLRTKMSSSNFPAVTLARVDALPPDDIAWFHPGRHPAQGIIAHSSSTEQALATSGTDTVVALSLAGDSTGSALDQAHEATGNALSGAGNATGRALNKSYHHTQHALANSAKHLGKALHRGDDPAPAPPQ